jgi:hypothetical protein
MNEPSHPPQRPRDRIAFEGRALARCFQMTNGNSAAQTITTTILVGAWAVMTILLSVEAVASTPPPMYGAFSGVVFLIVGRMWNLEVERLLPGKDE